MRNRRFLNLARIIYGLPLWAVVSAASAEGLSVNGAQLAPVVLQNVAAGVVEKSVTLEGDTPEASFVVVQMPGNPPLMRGREGVFQPWDRDTAHLADNGFEAVDGKLHFKVLNQDMTSNNFPIRVTLYYRTADGLKYGYFDVLRAN
jgi:hypothetical protein